MPKYVLNNQSRLGIPAVKMNINLKADSVFLSCSVFAYKCWLPIPEFVSCLFIVQSVFDIYNKDNNQTQVYFGIRR